MTVVRNEFESGENNPQRVLWGRLQAVAFDWHNYGNLTIGARSDIENVDIGRLQAFYRLYYQPDNAVLIVAGHFDPERTLAQIAKNFGPIPKPTRTLPALYTKEPVQDGERAVTVRRGGGTQFVAALYHTVPGAHPDAIAIEALGEVHDRRAGRPPVQGAGRDQEGERGRIVDAFRSPIRATSSSGRRCPWATRSTPRATRCSPPSRTCARIPSPRPKWIACARRRCASSTMTFNDPQRLGIAHVRSRSRSATGGSSSCSATAGAS